MSREPSSDGDPYDMAGATSAPVDTTRTVANDRAEADIPPPPEPPEEARSEPLTDLEAARRMVAAHGQRLRYVLSWRRWLVWDGRRWAEDDTGEVARAAKATAQAMLRAAVDVQSDDRRKALVKAAQRAESAAGQRGMIELAGTEGGWRSARASSTRSRTYSM